MEQEKVVMYGSAEAATRVDMPGWKSRLGHFYPGTHASSEHGARWSGCTHMVCECGNIFEKGRIRCRSCDAKKDAEKYYSLPVEKWDGTTPLCLFGTDTYFFGDSVLDYLADLPLDEVVYICKCKPGYLHTLDYEDWADDLPEDGEFPDAVVTAMQVLNEKIREAGPVCWYEDAISIDVEDLRARLNSRVQP
jgi:hypothetical protein